jgi:hypothetical protein
VVRRAHGVGRAGSRQPHAGLALVIFPPLSRRVSLTRLCLVACTASGFLYALLPFVVAFADEAVVLAALLVQQCALRFSLGTTFTCIFTILNNSVPAEARGRMQGVAMTVGSLARAIGPTVGAELFAWSLTNGSGFPIDQHFVFLRMCVANAAPVAIGFVAFTKALDAPIDANGTIAASDAPTKEVVPARAQSSELTAESGVALQLAVGLRTNSKVSPSSGAGLKA